MRRMSKQTKVLLMVRRHVVFFLCICFTVLTFNVLSNVIITPVNHSLGELVRTAMVKIESDEVLVKLVDDVMTKKKSVLQAKMTPEGTRFMLIFFYHALFYHVNFEIILIVLECFFYCSKIALQFFF